MTIAIARECGAATLSFPFEDGAPYKVAFTEKELAAYEARIRADQRERDATKVPTSWLDSLLTGRDAIGKTPYSGTDIQRLFSALADRIRSGEGERT